MRTYSPLLCVQLSDRSAMHILMATVDALDIPSDDIVLSRTSLQQIREENRHYQSNEAKSDTIDKVYYILSNNIYF